MGVAGPPGAGKSTLASEVARRVNLLWPQKYRSFDSEVEPPDVAIVLPMDGFHLYRHQLDAMEVSLLLLLNIVLSQLLGGTSFGSKWRVELDDQRYRIKV